MSGDLEQIRKRVQDKLGVKVLDKRIKSIFINTRYHWQPSMTVEVGKRYSNLEPDAPEEEVIAIFESTVFCVCTQNRGISSGIPYLFHKQDVQQVTYFKD